MKTIIHTTLTDEQRKVAARVLFNRAAPIKRAELTAFVEGCIAQLVSNEPAASKPALTVKPYGGPAAPSGNRHAALYVIDPEDEAVLAGKSDSYIRGWNMVKQRYAQLRRQQSCK